MIDWSKPVRTTCGKPVRVVCEDRKDLAGWNRVVLIDRGDHESADVADSRGRGDRYHYMNVPEKCVSWVNICLHSRWGMIYPSKEEADTWASEDRIACVRVEYEIPVVEPDE